MKTGEPVDTIELFNRVRWIKDLEQELLGKCRLLPFDDKVLPPVGSLMLIKVNMYDSRSNIGFVVGCTYEEGMCVLLAPNDNENTTFEVCKWRKGRNDLDVDPGWIRIIETSDFFKK